MIFLLNYKNSQVSFWNNYTINKRHTARKIALQTSLIFKKSSLVYYRNGLATTQIILHMTVMKFLSLS